MEKKILFIGIPQAILYSKSIKQALCNLNYQVIEPEYIPFKDQNAFQKRFFRKNFLNKFFSEQNQKYIEAVKKYNPDFVFVINNSRMGLAFLQYCEKINLPIYMYCIDSIRWCDKALEHMHYYTDIFSYEPSDTTIEFRKNQFIKFVPLGYDDNIYLPSISENKPYDLCFVGNLDKRRLTILEEVAKYAYKNNLSFQLYTRNQIKKIDRISLIPKILARRLKFKLKYPYLTKFIINELIIGKDLSDLYNKTKICINIHVGTYLGMHTGPNPRTFELLACKAFEIIDEGHINQTILKNGRDLVEFNTPKDLIDKIDYYLKHEVERNNIANSGYATTKKYYNLQTLIEKIIKQIN